MSYMVDKSPAEDKLLQRQIRVWEPKEHRPTLTWSRSGYKPYSTYVAPRSIPRSHANTKQSQEQILSMDTSGQGATVVAMILSCKHCIYPEWEAFVYSHGLTLVY